MILVVLEFLQHSDRGRLRSGGEVRAGKKVLEQGCRGAVLALQNSAASWS